MTITITDKTAKSYFLSDKKLINHYKKQGFNKIIFKHTTRSWYLTK